MGLYDRDYMRGDSSEGRRNEPSDWETGPPSRRKIVTAIIALILLFIFVYAFVF